ncbi:Uncharacterised protein [Clostridioides difficile]|nr:Uncharacterised protein [Clostridioides difficile]
MSGLLKPYSAYTRFILTKWYVKKFNIAGKGEMDIGFILTKWYVKEICIEALKQDKYCFILTKWYVKFIFLTHIIQLIQF